MDNWLEHIDSPGEHKLLIPCVHGQLEAIVSVPPSAKENTLLFIGHPNSIQGGSMQNKVVTTIARAAKEQSFSSLRFNFRGVGKSTGVYDEGYGESEDLITLIETWKSNTPAAQLLLAGFSFGSFVCYRAALIHPPKLLLSVAPAVDRHDFGSANHVPSPWEVIMGEADEVVDYQKVAAFAQARSLPLHPFADTGHFFHGKLIALRHCLEDIFMRVPL